MKHKEAINPIQPAELVYVPDWQAAPFRVSSDYEDVLTIKEQVDARPAPRREPAPKPAVAVPEPKAEYLNLGELDGRTAARMALKCFARDVRNFGRTNKYKEFKQRRWAEQNAAFDMEMGLVDAVHCRLHERVLKQSSGR